jgi:hypothetical protein
VGEQHGELSLSGGVGGWIAVIQVTTRNL